MKKLLAAIAFTLLAAACTPCSHVHSGEEKAACPCHCQCASKNSEHSQAMKPGQMCPKCRCHMMNGAERQGGDAPAHMMHPPMPMDAKPAAPEVR